MIKIISAEYINDFRLLLTFEEFTEINRTKILERREVNLEAYLKGKKTNGIFEPLKSKEYFKQFHLNSNTVEWSNGADIAPKRLFELSKELT